MSTSQRVGRHRSNRQFRYASIVPALSLLAATSASAAVTTVDPFVGQYRENFDEFSAVNAVQVLSVFDNHGDIRNVTSGGAIKLEFFSSLNGDPVVPISGMMMGQLGIADWEFNQPMTRFGGMWENNSGADDATVSFYDASNMLLGTQIASVPVHGQQWVWNGWQSDVPFTRVHVLGNGLINGFIWYENMEAAPAPSVPEPVALVISSSMLLLKRRRVRRRDF